MKKIRLLSLAMVCSMLFCTPVMAAEITTTEDAVIENNPEVVTESLESVKLEEMSPISLSEEQYDVLSDDEIQTYGTTPDDYEENDSPTTAFSYSKVETLTTQVTSNNDLYRLGMKAAGLHSETDEDWFYTSLTAGETYFVDLRNVGRRDWYIELYYLGEDLDSSYFYSTNPEYNSVYKGAAEKYFYFTAKDTGKFYIRICSGNDWVDSMYYFFYVGPAIQTFDIVDMPTYGGVYLFGTAYQTYTCDLRNAFPSTTAIININLSDSFSKGTCSHLSKYMSAGGRTYYNTPGDNAIKSITNASIGQLWTFGAKCSQNTHSGVHWSGRINGKFKCIMEPYPGNELDL